MFQYFKRSSGYTLWFLTRLIATERAYDLERGRCDGLLILAVWIPSFLKRIYDNCFRQGILLLLPGTLYLLITCMHTLLLHIVYIRTTRRCLLLRACTVIHNLKRFLPVTR